jgi:hypothetical protein
MSHRGIPFHKNDAAAGLKPANSLELHGTGFNPPLPNLGHGLMSFADIEGLRKAYPADSLPHTQLSKPVTFSNKIRLLLFGACPFLCRED